MMTLVQMMHVFREAFETRMLPIFHEVTIGAIRQFHPEQYVSYAFVAAAGALLASVSLFAIGVWLRRMPEKISTEAQRARIDSVRGKASEWLPWLLILSPCPIGGMLIVAAGFFRIPVWKAALAILAAEVLWRVSPLL